MYLSRALGAAALGMAALFCDRAHAERYLIVGIGADSCAHWMSNDNNRLQGDIWIQGFWSGLNAVSRANTGVGSTTDNDGLFGEVEKACAGQPSLLLIDATVSAYKKLAAEKR